MGKKLVSLVGMAESGTTPKIALYQVRKGKPVKKLAEVTGGAITLDKTWAKSPGSVAFGPLVDDPQKLESEHLLHLRTDTLLGNDPYEISKEWWDKWIFRKVCVSGSVKRCSPGILPLKYGSAQLAALGPFGVKSVDTGCSTCGSTAKSVGSLGALSPLSPGRPSWPRLCRPVCHGVVEIYEKCCSINIPPLDFCDLFPFHRDCLSPIDLCKRYPQICLDPCLLFPRLCGGLPEIDPLDPLGPIAWPEVDPVVVKILKRVRSKEDPVTMAKMALPPRVIGDIKAMMRMSPDSAREYLMERPHLHPIFFTCNTKKIGETMLRPDGSFTHCYLTGKKPCAYTTYAFKVKQWQNGNWVEVYDGLASHDYFTIDEAKVLYANFKAVACQNEPGPEYEKPYVMLQKIGATDSYKLTSPAQLNQEGINSPLPANAGLVDMAYATDCPWSSTLSFRLKMSDEIYEDIKARYYRISYAECDGNGNATEDFIPLFEPITWRKLVYTGGHFAVDYMRLGPNLPVGNNHEYGLYSIPDPAEDDWLDDIHGAWNSKAEPGKRYILKIEIFKEDGTLITPGTPGGGFVYLHWDGEESFTEITQKSLVHVLWTNHNSCYASIEDLRLNGGASSEDCQFITGQAGDNISLGYRAYHEKGPPAGTFMRYFNLQWQRGFNGTLQPWVGGSANQPATLDAGPPAISPVFTLTEMFAGDTSISPHKKCTFMARLYVSAKHTNGSTRLSEYDDSDYASFALEMTPAGP